MSAQQATTKGRARLSRLAAILALVALALVVRLPRLDAFVTPDEMKWFCRSINFYRGIASGELARTIQTGHPGVITMWLGAPFSGARIMAPELDACANPSLADILQESAPETPAQLAGYLYAARRGVALWTALLLGLTAWLLAELVGWPAAMAAAVLMALDPFYVAHGRFLHLDAVVTSLLLPGMLALTSGLRTAGRSRLALAGALLALAALNKSPALFGLGYAGLATLGWGLVARWPWRRIVVTGLWWGLPALGVYIALWPALWVQPLATLKTVFGTALFYASQPHTNSNFFLGAPRPDPGWEFYPVALAFRLTPWSSIAAVLGLGWWLGEARRKGGGRWRALIVPLGFALAYGIFMTLGQKKFDRYLLPVFPFVQMLAGLGLAAGATWLVRRWRALRPVAEATGATLAVLIALGLGLTVLREAPYYLTYYNPLVGGKQAAVRTLLVGWGEGLDAAGAYLSGLSSGAERVAVSRALPGLAPFYSGRTVHQELYDPATSDYVVLYLNEIQRRLDERLMAQYYDSAEPLAVIRVKGIDYVWIYANRTHGLPQAYIAEHADPARDAIVIGQPSLLAREYEGSLAVTTIPDDATREQALATLDAAVRSAERVWYVRYDEKNPNPLLAWVDLQWRTHAPLLDERRFADLTLTLWDVSNAPSFVAPPTQALVAEGRFGQDLALQGATAGPLPAEWGRALGVTLNWQVLRNLDRYLACYVHVYDEYGHRVGQGDLWLEDESLRPTVEWKQGATVQTEVPVAILPGLAPGRYRLVVGVYDRVVDQPLAPEDGQRVGDRALLLGEIEVTPTARSWALQEAGLQGVEGPALGGLTLRGLGLSSASPAFGETLTVALAWQAGMAARDDYVLALDLLGADGQALAQGTFPLAAEGHPTSRWQPGEMYWRNYDLAIPADAPAGEAMLQATLLNARGRAVAGPATVAGLEVRGHLFAPPRIAHPQAAGVGEQIVLLGYALEPESELRPGGALQLTLYWQAHAAVAGRYTVFTHLLDAGGAVRAQMDGEPLAGRYPTTGWQTGEVIADTYRLTLAADAPAGAYRLEVGMYDAAVGVQRIPAYDAAGARLEQDRILLDQPIVVGP